MTREQMIDEAVRRFIPQYFYGTMTAWARSYAPSIRAEFRRIAERERWHRHAFRLDRDGFMYCDVCKKVPDKFLAEG